MPVYSKYIRVALITIAVSAIFACSTFLVHISSTDTPTRLFLRSTLLEKQVSLTPGKHEHADENSYRFLVSHVRPSDTLFHSRTFSIASKIYVLSLPRRVDRRTAMDSLSRALDLEFCYVDAVDAADASVTRAIDTLTSERQVFRERSRDMDPMHGSNISFLDEEQNSNIFDASHFVSPSSFVELGGPIDNLGASISSIPPSTGDNIPNHDGALPLPCATPEDPFPVPLDETEINLLPPWRLLSRGMVACWMAHLDVIRRVAIQHTDTVTIIFEDDVDMEFDIERRLVGMWPALPARGWDIVVLGHCHSNETTHPPLPGAASLRPSHAPKCTHAYALSLVGARKLFRMLSTPGFAYSRALDQAISWLIKTGRLRSYSVVPAIVIQSKRTSSDIWRPLYGGTGSAGQRQNMDNASDKGSKWRDYLVDSTLERIEMLAVSGLGVAAGTPL